MPFGNVYGYTGLNLDGISTLQTSNLAGVTLAAGDVVLTEAQCANGIISVATGHASNAITIPAAVALANPNKLYIIHNADGALAALIRVAGGTAITVAAARTAMVRINPAGTEVVRVTADAVLT